MLLPEACGQGVGRLEDCVASTGSDEVPGAVGRAQSEAPGTSGELNTILDTVPAAIAYVDKDLQNQFTNRAYEEWIGLAAGRMVGRHVRDVVGPEVFRLVEPFMRRALAGETQNFERDVLSASGEPRHLDVSYTPNMVDGAVDGFVVLGTDSTERVEAESEVRETHRRAALAHDRQRIAADLHDLVIQGLYATALQLNAAASAAPTVDPRIAAAVQSIDQSIHDLRSSIHDLNQGFGPSEFSAALDRVVHHATQTLGFAPTVTSAGPFEPIPSAIFAEMLAVLSESLSNVARHAVATEVHVTITAHDDGVDLQVADDGHGIARLDRVSGMANMRTRAQRFGGSCTWHRNDPNGTVVDWHVPSTEQLYIETNKD